MSFKRTFVLKRKRTNNLRTWLAMVRGKNRFLAVNGGRLKRLRSLNDSNDFIGPAIFHAAQKRLAFTASDGQQQQGRRYEAAQRCGELLTKPAQVQ
jgi:hypothetical protein